MSKRVWCLRLHDRLRGILLVAVLMQFAGIELVRPHVNAAFQAITRAAVWTHRYAFIDDVEEDTRVRFPQRHRRVGTIGGEIARGELDHRCGSRQRTQSAPRLVTCVRRAAFALMQPGGARFKVRLGRRAVICRGR